MKRRIIIILLAVCILAAATPVSLADDICFVAVNDQLPPELGLAYFSDGTLYVPYSAFDSFGIYHTLYASTESTVASVFTSKKQLYFDLNTGETTDAFDTVYYVSGVTVGGQPYVPVSFVCEQFGLNWSYVTGTGSGDICRIKDSNVVLSDAVFLSAASQMMANRYAAYISGTTGGGGNGGANDGEDGELVYLSFQGLPSDSLLKTLSGNGIKAAFFVSSRDVSSDPDRIRRICGEGHSIGVLCSSDPGAEYAETAQLIFDAARVWTVLIASSLPEYDSLCASAADELGLAPAGYSIDGVKSGAGISGYIDVTSVLTYYPERADVRLLCDSVTDAALPSIITYALSVDCAFGIITETDNFLPGS